MTLTIGDAPFGRRRGAFNFDTGVLKAHTLYFEDCPKRIRAITAGETVVDSQRVKRLHETGLLPVYYFPQDDVRSEALTKSARTTHCPFKGDAVYWSLRVADRLIENAVWSYPEPLSEAPPLAGYMAFYWEAADTWLEEDEPVFAHPRDPYHRVDVLASSRHVRVAIRGETIAETHQPKLVFETGLPTRYYLPTADVRSDRLHQSDTRTECPYKGVASYWSAEAGGEQVPDVAWSYPQPLPEAHKLSDTVCFLGERVEIEVDGQ